MKRNKRLFLVRQMENKKHHEISTKPHPRINEKSKRLALSKERRGKIHERLHRDGKKKLKHSKDQINDIFSIRDERSSSCPRKSVQGILNDETKELTFKPDIDK